MNSEGIVTKSQWFEFRVFTEFTEATNAVTLMAWVYTGFRHIDPNSSSERSVFINHTPVFRGLKSLCPIRCCPVSDTWHSDHSIHHDYCRHLNTCACPYSIQFIPKVSATEAGNVYTLDGMPVDTVSNSGCKTWWVITPFPDFGYVAMCLRQKMFERLRRLNFYTEMQF